ncbi:MAG: D-alanyl-D-alanine carboxypeptidase family protein [Parvularculaceae bacterium]|nr:D-alanyl-D-alanine carboxypeptidase family protein [Parvularculaceae bacterium]
MSVSLRIFLCAIAFVVFAGAFSSPAEAARRKRPVPAPKYSAIVMHADSGDVLLNKYADEKRFPASLTKMMTLYLLFEEIEAGRLNLDSPLSVSAIAAGQPPSKLGLTAGSTITVEEAIMALIVKSANDVAVTVAEGVSGSEWKFAQAMTLRARDLGMNATTFKNASGLPNSKQMTTARDLAILSQRLLKDHPQYFPYFNTQEFAWNGRTYRTHNALVRTYAGADGLKTGYTARSGFNLATTAQRDGQRLIGIVLGGRSVKTRDAHMAEILTTAFADIQANPVLIASVHRFKPTPRLKPTLVAELERRNATPTLAGNEPLRNEILIAAASLAPAPGGVSKDGISALIAAVDSDDFNEYERVRLSAVTPSDQGMGEGMGEGDIEENAVWSVQIGAYSTKSMAQQELEAAAIAANLTDRTRVVAPMPKLDGSLLYRARFVNLTETEAAAACTKIQAAALPCFTSNDAGAR